MHPDLVFVEREPDAKEIKVGQMRAVRSRAFVLPNEAERSVYIVRDADTMRLEAQNAMLKVFEEPPAHAMFILLCSSAEGLIATVRSRCVEISLPPKGREIPELAERLLSSKTGYDIMKAAVELEKLSRPELVDMISFIRECALREYKAGRLSPERLAAISAGMDKAERFMAHNVSAGYISGVVMTAFI